MIFYGTNRQPTTEDYRLEYEEHEKRLTPEQKEVRAQAEERRRRAFAGATGVLTPCSQEQHKKIYIIIQGAHIVKFRPEIEKLDWSGHEDNLEKQILDATDGDTEFQKAILSVRPQIERHVKKSAERAAAIQQEEADSQTLIKKEAESLQNGQRDRRADQIILRASKAKQTRVFTDEEKAKMLHVMSFSQEDLERSRANLIEKKTKLLKQIKDCDATLSQLEIEQKPFNEKVAELRGELDYDE